MYSSWFKNDPSESRGGLPPQRPSNAGTIWFVAMMASAFGLAAIAVFFPQRGLIIALCGLPFAGLVFTVWMLRLLRVI